MSIYHDRPLAFAGTALQRDMSNWKRVHSFPSWFRAIPPERVGLDGQYDHHGLQKRVEAVFRECFNPQVLAELSVSQRGRVVVLHGHVSSEEMLTRLVEIAEQVEGTIRVEATWVTVGDKTGLMATNKL